MKINEISDCSIKVLMTWFTNQEELTRWAGPGFNYPFSFNSFKTSLNLSASCSYSLSSDEDELLAFAQYSLRLNRIHLARIVINPDFRGQGLVKQLITRLLIKAKSEFKVNQCSLFVFADNHSAISAYQKLGFSLAKYPETLPAKDCLFMVKSLP